jgi:hypothetical protein
LRILLRIIPLHLNHKPQFISRQIKCSKLHLQYVK